MPRSAYMCEVECALVLPDKQVNFESAFVKTVMIDSGYQSTYMPVIYLIAKVTTEIYSMISNSEKEGKIYLRMDSYNAYSATSLSKTYIEGQFTYKLAEFDKNYTQDLSDGLGADATYHTVKMALMSMEISNLARTSINGVYGNIDQDTLVTNALGGLDVVVKKPLYNPEYETIYIPALNSKMKLIKFLYEKCPLYDTNYIFFIDFNKAYLLDLTGEYCEGRDGQFSTVYIDIRNFTTETSYYEGMEIKNDAYYLYINPADVRIIPNKGSDMISNQYVFVDDNGGVDYVDLEVNNHIDSGVKQSFRRGNNAALYKNMAESNTMIVELVKENMDGSLLTPNKEYIIVNTDQYAEYNGKYTLLSKQEYFINNSGEFGLSTTIKLRKVGNIISLGAGVANAAARKSGSAVSRRKSYTSNKISSSSSNKTTSNKSNKSEARSIGTTSGGARASAICDIQQLPTVKRIKATNSRSSLKRLPRKISGEG